jgi:hypothetical protein
MAMENGEWRMGDIGNTLLPCFPFSILHSAFSIGVSAAEKPTQRLQGAMRAIKALR